MDKFYIFKTTSRLSRKLHLVVSFVKSLYLLCFMKKFFLVLPPTQTMKNTLALFISLPRIKQRCVLWDWNSSRCSQKSMLECEISLFPISYIGGFLALKAARCTEGGLIPSSRLRFSQCQQKIRLSLLFSEYFSAWLENTEDTRPLRKNTVRLQFNTLLYCLFAVQL